MGEHGEADQEGLGQRRLVDLAGHDEEGFGVGHGAVDKRYDGGVCQVDAGEERKCVAGVALHTGYYFGARRPPKLSLRCFFFQMLHVYFVPLPHFLLSFLYPDQTATFGEGDVVQ